MCRNCAVIEDLFNVKQITEQFYKGTVIIALLKFRSFILE
jgi:hypothetical protein